ncbi:hypothetical protein [Sphingomonas sp. MMS24-J13]|uniref:hypothetical protein n=1 Tax=Sphingomonas sp. MMS24-J13 TaxID=3238686 RepID=UPI00384B8605
MMAGKSAPQHRTVTASLLLDAIGASLQNIADEDRATDADLGAVLGKSKDSAERYRKAIGDMGAISFLRGCAKWDGRFANPVLAQIGMKLVPLDTSDGNDRQGVTTVMRAGMALLEALENDNIVDDEELDDRRALIEAGGRVFNQYRERLRLRLPKPD